MIRYLLSLVTLAILLTACSGEVAAPAPDEAAAASESGVEGVPPTPTVEAQTSADQIADAPTTQGAAEGADNGNLSLPPVEQIMAAFAEPSQTSGEILLLYGQVLDVNALPVPGAVVEIWQTDAAGVYDHPGDPSTADRDRSFQFYGSARTDSDGWYAFRTIVPGRYEPRPRHIHFKVKEVDETLLTSQFYFSDDIAEVEGEGMFRAVGESGDQLLLQLVQGDGQLLAYGAIVVDRGIGAGELALTPSQGEGPYYPLVTVSAFDNDLVRLP